MRKRLASYFHAQSEGSHVDRLVKRIAEIEVILVNTETESFLLENNLIARHQPPFNRLIWREARRYPTLVLTEERFPRLVPYQAGHPNKELCEATIRQRFGPFLSHRFCLGVLEFARDYFQLRTCQPLAEAVCLRFHLQQCGGICEGRIPEEQYSYDVENVIRFLSARPTEIIARIRQQMWSSAEKMLFERAQRLKELIAILEGALGGQLIEREVDHDQEMIYFEGEAALAASFRKGSLVGMRLYNWDGKSNPAAAKGKLVQSICENTEVDELIVNDLHGIDALREIHAGIILRTAHQETEAELIDLCRMNFAYRIAQRPQIPR